MDDFELKRIKTQQSWEKLSIPPLTAKNNLGRGSAPERSHDQRERTFSSFYLKRLTCITGQISDHQTSVLPTFLWIALLPCGVQPLISRQYINLNYLVAFIPFEELSPVIVCILLNQNLLLTTQQRSSSHLHWWMAEYDQAQSLNVTG